MGFRRRLAALGLLALGAPSLALAQTQRGSTRGGTEQAGYLSFTFPAGWARVDYPDGGIVYTGQIRDEVCTFSVLPLRPSSGDLLRDAIAVFSELFKTWSGAPPPWDGAMPGSRSRWGTSVTRSGASTSSWSASEDGMRCW